MRTGIKIMQTVYMAEISPGFLKSCQSFWTEAGGIELHLHHMAEQSYFADIESIIKADGRNAPEKQLFRRQRRQIQ